MNKRLFIVIPVFNGWPQTQKCLDSLQASDYDTIEVIIVDHGSTDETPASLPLLFPQVTHIIADSTLWWAGAVNVGVRYALSKGARFIMLLNNDCTVEKDTITRLMAYFHDPEKKVIAPIQLDFQTERIVGGVADHCFLLGFPTLIFPWKTKLSRSSQKLMTTRLILGGRGVVIPSEVFQKAGIFDEHNLPHYGADHDFYLRVRQKGIPLYIAANAVVKVDSTRTTSAHSVEKMDLRSFYQTLTDKRSHKNVKYLTALFKKHYPFNKLYFLGVVFNLARYFSIFLIKKA